MTTAVKNVANSRAQYGILMHTLPKSLSAAAGIMKHKRKALEKHLQTVRKEWK